MTVVFGWRRAVDSLTYRPVMADLALSPEPFEPFEPLDLANWFTSLPRRNHNLSGSIPSQQGLVLVNVGISGSVVPSVVS